MDKKQRDEQKIKRAVEDSHTMDIDLCFKAMGVPFDASPQAIEKAYATIMEIVNRELKSSDPVVRQKAREDLEVFRVIYDRIKTSLTYVDRKSEDAKESARREAERRAKEQLIKLVICPSCSKSVNASFKFCPYCKNLMSNKLFDKLLYKYLTPQWVISAAAAVVIVLLLLFFLRGKSQQHHPTQGSQPQQVFDSHSSAVFESRSSAAFESHSSSRR